MGREQKRRQEARRVKQLLERGQVDRRSLTAEEAQKLFVCIDRGEVQQFGIAALAAIELNGHYEAPWCCGVPKMSLLDFAAWRGRDSFVSALVAANADPTEKALDDAASIMAKLPRSYVAWLARAAALSRLAGQAASVHLSGANCICKDGNSQFASLWVFSPCAHRCCPLCPWRAFRGFGYGQVPELLCPVCGVSFQDPALSFVGQRRGIIRHGPAGPLAEHVPCKTCGCLNAPGSCCCINCSFAVSQVSSFTQEPEAELQSLVFFLPDWLRTHGQKTLRRRRTLKKWQALPDEIPEDMEERFELQAALEASRPKHGNAGSSEFCLPAFSAILTLCTPVWRPLLKCLGYRDASLRSAKAKAKAKRPLAGAFRALSPSEVAAEKLGVTRKNRSERFRAAAEVGDIRRVQAMLDAGVDIDSPNEYGQTPLFLAAFEGHRDVVELLLSWGADPAKPCHGGGLPALAPSASALRMLPSPRCPVLPVRLPLPEHVAHLGALHVDGFFEECFLTWLQELWKSLPPAPFAHEGDAPDEPLAEESQQKKMACSRSKARGRGVDRSRQDSAPQRSYYFDADGLVTAQLAAAAECAGLEAVPQMRFLHYARAGGSLPPHTDLSRRDWHTGQRTSHTFILYLEGAAEEGGGETVLLESLSGGPLAEVSPVRGRLLIFPHDCAHKAMPVVQPKLLLRGEMRIKTSIEAHRFNNQLLLVVAMPRGPGKRSNYNLDYSRFNGVENQDQERCVDEASTDGAEDFAVALRNMPPELQEAYRLTMISRSTGDEAAQKRANELVLQAVDKGGPQVRETFMKEISGHLPEGTLRGMDDSQFPQNSMCRTLSTFRPACSCDAYMALPAPSAVKAGSGSACSSTCPPRPFSFAQVRAPGPDHRLSRIRPDAIAGGRGGPHVEASMHEPWVLGGAALGGCGLIARSAKRRGLRRAALPDLLQSTLGKRELKRVISWTLAQRGRQETKDMLDNMKTLGFSWATRAGISLGVDDMSVPAEKAALCDGSQQRQLQAEAKYRNGEMTVVEKFLNVTEEWTRTSEQVKNEAVSNFKENDPNNPVYMMSTSGARGNISQVRQLVAMRGLMADAKGQLIDVPIQHCLREGMTVTDMLISGHGARKGVIDTALRTANSGYLYRRLDFTGSPVVVRAEDCGTEDSIPMELKGMRDSVASFKDRIRGRVLGKPVFHPESKEVLFDAGHMLTADEAGDIETLWKSLAETVEVPPVHVRSPLGCRLHDGICAKCYGEDLSTPGELVGVGHPSGTIAAQSMGEPGTQLTMRTFHTGGAFEGSAGEGVVAKHAGHVRLQSSDGEISKDDVSRKVRSVSEWRRSPQGEVGCVLAKAATLQITDGSHVLQTENLEAGTYVKVLDGASVSFGQVLYQKPVKSSPSTDEDDIETLDKPINSDQDGEILVQPADTLGSCIDEGGKLVWVLQGSAVDFEHEGSTLAVKEGDAVEPGQPLAQEWAATKCAGVPRFQEPPRSADKDAVSLRTDFDFFELAADRTTEYHKDVEIPPSLLEEPRNLPSVRPYLRQAVSRALDKADDIRSAKPAAPTSSSVFTQVWTDDAAPKLRILCSPPSLEAGASIFPTSRNLTDDCVVPSGGLVLHVIWEGKKTILWAPEESIPLLNEKKRQASEDKGQVKLGRPLLFKRTARTTIVQPDEHESQSDVFVHRCKDRVYYSIDISSLDIDADASWECAIKPGEVFLAPSKYFAEGFWWDAAEDDGVYLHSRAVPPNHAVIPELPTTKIGSDWMIAEILDDPRAADSVRVLLRRTKSVKLPPARCPVPSESHTMTFWTPLRGNGVVESAGPLVLAHEVSASVGRHYRDTHCTSIVPTRPADGTSVPPRAFLNGTSLDVASEWGPSSLCVVQHSPLGTPRAAVANSSWQEAMPRYISCDESEHLIARRTLPSKASGIVCRAKEGTRRLTAVVLNDQDLLRVPCHAQPSVRLGDLVRQHDRLSSKDVSPAAGQVVSVQTASDGGAVALVFLRRASSYLVTNKGSVLVRDGNVVQMGDCLATEPLAVPRTSDIVQGLPRIDRLFEAANGQLQARLDRIFEEEAAQRSSLDAAYAARRRFEQELLAEIQSAYGEQGVDISSKHIEAPVQVFS
ncbi:rpoC2 [Symbiodinium necroappetens]|uniref:DNA-directed RNA polymerase n=1 Tax=Symbiodinium necroappetens TaxID=1628268 RepID=A0A812VXH2_9DINO|nr:rpoC2 [Symbiodinium necroappetens]